MPDRPKILFVDDEPSVLDALRRKFRSKNSRWKMDFIEQIPDVLRSIATTKYDVVVSDMRMPAMDGATLLTTVRQSTQGAIRFILSGQADDESIVRSAVVCHQYHSKPCTTDRLRDAIEGALRIHQIIPNVSSRNRVIDLATVPCLSRTVDIIGEELIAGRPSKSNICSAVSLDVGMSAKFLQFASNDMFGLRCSMHSIERLFGGISNDQLNSLMKQPQFVETIHESETTSAFIQEKIKRAQNTARLASIVASQLQTNDSEIAFKSYLAGLLGEFGTFLMLGFHGSAYRQMIVQAKSVGIPLDVQECRTFGANRHQLAQGLLTIWGCPEDLTTAVGSTKSICELRSQIGSIEFCVALARRLDEVFSATRKEQLIADLEQDMRSIGMSAEFILWCNLIQSQENNLQKVEQICHLQESCW